MEPLTWIVVGFVSLPIVCTFAYLIGYYGWAGVLKRIEHVRNKTPYAPKYDPDNPYGRKDC